MDGYIINIPHCSLEVIAQPRSQALREETGNEVGHCIGCRTTFFSSIGYATGHPRSEKTTPTTYTITYKPVFPSRQCQSNEQAFVVRDARRISTFRAKAPRLELLAGVGTPNFGRLA